MIANEITLLNETVLECLNESNENKIVKIFTEVSRKVLRADYCITWLNSGDSPKLEIVYKSANLPFTPREPREKGRSNTAIKTSTPNFVTNTKDNLDTQYVDKFVKSFVIIPLVYKKAVYGSMAICFKKAESFPREKRILCTFIGNSLAQAITIRRLVDKSIFFEQEKTKVEFMANATHELRTPLAIIQGNVDIALMENNFKSAKEALQAIKVETHILSEILKDLVILTTGQNTKNFINQNKVNIGDMLYRIAERIRVVALKKNIKVKINKKTSGLIVLGDENYLEEKLFLNIVKNAIYYGKEGGHIVIDMDKDQEKIIVTIADDGIGISKQTLPKIFGRFYRGDKAHTDRSNHSGLGLAIAKWVVEKHKGTITAKSVKDKGSTFTVTLPLAKKK